MTEYRALIEHIANGHGLDPDLVEAVVLKESEGKTDAFRWEPRFFARYLRGKPEYARYVPRRAGSSYGLMQIMFSTAKQYGFGDVPELLFIPDVGLQFGCLHLAALLKKEGGDRRKALEAYNGGLGNVDGRGADAEYAEGVLQLLETVKSTRAHT